MLEVMRCDTVPVGQSGHYVVDNSASDDMLVKYCTGNSITISKVCCIRLTKQAKSLSHIRYFCTLFTFFLAHAITKLHNEWNKISIQYRQPYLRHCVIT